MKKTDKSIVINDIAASVKEYSHFYVAEASGLSAEKSSNLRRECFKREIKMVMVKNTLLIKALEQVGSEYESMFSTFKGTTAVFFSNTGNVPAKLIKEFSKANKMPLLKSAYVEECIYLGENQLEALCNVKTKNELIGDVIGLLQSPMKNVISGLQSGGNTIHGILKTLGDK